MSWSAWSMTFEAIRKGNDGLRPYRLSRKSRRLTQ
jgi:hypothetical protein